MNPIFFFFFLSIFQIAVAAIGSIVAFIITIVPGLRSARIKAIQASIFGAIGGFVGEIIAYILIIAMGLAYQVIDLFHLESSSINLADAAPWILVTGYIASMAGRAYMGWKIRISVFSQSA